MKKVFLLALAGSIAMISLATPPVHHKTKSAKKCTKANCSPECKANGTCARMGCDKS